MIPRRNRAVKKKVPDKCKIHCFGSVFFVQFFRGFWYNDIRVLLTERAN